MGLERKDKIPEERDAALRNKATGLINRLYAITDGHNTFTGPNFVIGADTLIANPKIEENIEDQIIRKFSGQPESEEGNSLRNAATEEVSKLINSRGAPYFRSWGTDQRFFEDKTPPLTEESTDSQWSQKAVLSFNYDGFLRLLVGAISEATRKEILNNYDKFHEQMRGYFLSPMGPFLNTEFIFGYTIERIETVPYPLSRDRSLRIPSLDPRGDDVPRYRVAMNDEGYALAESGLTIINESLDYADRHRFQ